ncbi:hypothetical protein AA313_de0210047 [Arthrobotrys entomopaga]|nr:hypothetical protein AA313_de0210047 [Arthrobotrys entomopaga]
MVYGAFYIVTDLAIWALPMPLVFKLKLKPKEKILAVITFSLGGIACVASGLRLWIIDTFADYSVKASSNLEVDVYTVVELNLALICACAPSVRALIIYYTPKVINKLESVGMSMSSDKTNDSEKSVGHENVTASTKS